MNKDVNNPGNISSRNSPFFSFQQYKQTLKNLIMYKLKFVICVNGTNYRFLRERYDILLEKSHFLW